GDRTRSRVEPAGQDREIGALFQGDPADGQTRRAGGRGHRHGSSLQIAVHAGGGRQAGQPELGGDIGGGDRLVAGGASAALQLFAGEEVHVRLHGVSLDGARGLGQGGAGGQGDQG